MSLKKTLLPAAVVLALLAVPAVALASVWLHEGKTLSEKTEFPLTSEEFVEIGGGILSCKVSATMTTSGGNTASITSYSETGCVPVNGALEGCEVTKVSAVGLPWSVELGAEALTVSGANILREFKACSISKAETTAPAETWAPFNGTGEPSTSEIALFHFQVEGGAAEVDGKASTYSNLGNLELNEAQRGKYGIG